jgi:hypothetical protein
MSGQADPRFPTHSETFSAEVVEPPQRTAAKTCLIGCLIMFVLAICVCGGFAWYIYANLGKIKALMSDAAREAIVSGIRQSELNEEEKDAIIAQVDRVVEQYKTGEITTEQLGRVMGELSQSPLMGVIMIYSIEAKYIQPSGLTDEEKQQSRRTMQRVLRAVLEEKVQQEELEDALDYVMDRRADGSRDFKDSVSDGDLRAFLAKLKDHADGAEIPDEPFEVRISDEFRQAVDRALEEK